MNVFRQLTQNTSPILNNLVNAGLKSILQSKLGPFLPPGKELAIEQVSTSNGDIVISDLLFSAERINEKMIGLPIQVKSLYVGSVRCSIPMINGEEKNSVLRITNVELVIFPVHLETPKQTPAFALRNISDSVPLNSSYMAEVSCLVDSTLEGFSATDDLRAQGRHILMKIFDNLLGVQLEISNLVFVLETSNKTRAIIVNIANLSLFDPSPSTKQNITTDEISLTKSLQFQDLSISLQNGTSDMYIRRSSATVPSAVFPQSYSPTQRVLLSCAGRSEGKPLAHEIMLNIDIRTGQEPKINLQGSLQELQIAISPSQLTFLLESFSEVHNFSQQVPSTVTRPQKTTVISQSQTQPIIPVNTTPAPKSEFQSDGDEDDDDAYYYDADSGSMLYSALQDPEDDDDTHRSIIYGNINNETGSKVMSFEIQQYCIVLLTEDQNVSGPSGDIRSTAEHFQFSGRKLNLRFVEDISKTTYGVSSSELQLQELRKDRKGAMEKISAISFQPVHGITEEALNILVESVLAKQLLGNNSGASKISDTVKVTLGATDVEIDPNLFTRILSLIKPLTEYFTEAAKKRDSSDDEGWEEPTTSHNTAGTTEATSQIKAKSASTTTTSQSQSTPRKNSLPGYFDQTLNSDSPANSDLDVKETSFVENFPSESMNNFQRQLNNILPPLKQEFQLHQQQSTIMETSFINEESKYFFHASLRALRTRIKLRAPSNITDDYLLRPEHLEFELAEPELTYYTVGGSPIVQYSVMFNHLLGFIKTVKPNGDIIEEVKSKIFEANLTSTGGERPQAVTVTVKSVDSIVPPKNTSYKSSGPFMKNFHVYKPEDRYSSQPNIFFPFSFPVTPDFEGPFKQYFVAHENIDIPPPPTLLDSDDFDTFKRATSDKSAISVEIVFPHFEITMSKSDYDLTMQLISALSSSNNTNNTNTTNTSTTTTSTSTTTTNTNTNSTISARTATNLAVRVHVQSGQWVFREDPPKDKSLYVKHKFEIDYEEFELFFVNGYQGTSTSYTCINIDRFAMTEVTEKFNGRSSNTTRDLVALSNFPPASWLKDTEETVNTENLKNRSAFRIRLSSYQDTLDSLRISRSSTLKKPLMITEITQSISYVDINNTTVYHKRGNMWLYGLYAFLKYNNPSATNTVPSNSILKPSRSRFYIAFNECKIFYLPSSLPKSLAVILIPKIVISHLSETGIPTKYSPMLTSLARQTKELPRKSNLLDSNTTSPNLLHQETKGNNPYPAKLAASPYRFEFRTVVLSVINDVSYYFSTGNNNYKESLDFSSSESIINAIIHDSRLRQTPTTSWIVPCFAIVLKVHFLQMDVAWPTSPPTFQLRFLNNSIRIGVCADSLVTLQKLLTDWLAEEERVVVEEKEKTEDVILVKMDPSAHANSSFFGAAETSSKYIKSTSVGTPSEVNARFLVEGWTMRDNLIKNYLDKKTGTPELERVGRLSTFSLLEPLPSNYPAPSFTISVIDLYLNIGLFSGNDWHYQEEKIIDTESRRTSREEISSDSTTTTSVTIPTPKIDTTTKVESLKPRNKKPEINITLTKLSLNYFAFDTTDKGNNIFQSKTDSSEERVISQIISRVNIIVGDFKISDNVDASTYENMLTVDLQSQRATRDPFLIVTLEDRHKLVTSGEIKYWFPFKKLEISLVPICLNLYEGTYRFLQKFLEDSGLIVRESSSVTAASSTDDFDENDFGTDGNIESVTVTTDLNSIPVFETVTISALRVTITHKGKPNSPMVALALDDFKIDLPRMRLKDVIGVEALQQRIREGWWSIILGCLPASITSFRPFAPIFTLGRGIAALFIAPYTEYKNKGNVQRGFRKGARQFFSTVLNVGSKMTVTTASLFEIIPGASAAGPHQSKFAYQPGSLADGVADAFKKVTQQVKEAREVIFEVPLEEYRLNGPIGYMGAMAKGVPLAVIKPVIGAADATGIILRAGANKLDKSHMKAANNKYKD